MNVTISSFVDLFNKVAQEIIIIEMIKMPDQFVVPVAFGTWSVMPEKIWQTIIDILPLVPNIRLLLVIPQQIEHTKIEEANIGCMPVSDTGRVGSGRVNKNIFDLGSGQKILTDFEFYLRQIAGLDEIIILLL